MKRMVCMAVLTMAGGVVCAQQAGVVGAPVVVGTQASSNAPTMMNRPGPAGAPSAVQSAMRADYTKYTQILTEISAVNAKLNPLEANIRANDPEIKALMDKQEAIKKEYAEIEKESMAKMDAKLNANPETAALVTKRNELTQQRMALMKQLQAARPGAPGMGMGGPRGMMPARMMSPTAPAASGAAPVTIPTTVLPPAAPAKVDQPVAAPAAEPAK